MTDTTAAEPTGGQTRDLSGARDMIVCEDVSKWYGDFQALDKVSATIKEQEVVVVLGPSGSGKSTWIRCINRLEIHQEGRIVVDDVELTNDMRNIEKVRSEVGMVFQQFNLFPHLTVIQNVALAQRKVRGRSKSEATEMAMRQLTRVGIPEKADAYPRQLSGGQQQRVAIARSLAMEPRVMLFDEPTSARTWSMSVAVSVSSKPSTVTVPVVGISSRLTQRSTVDLPEPLGPTMTSTSPSATSRSMSRTAWMVLSNVLETPRRRIIGSGCVATVSFISVLPSGRGSSAVPASPAAGTGRGSGSGR